MEARDDEAKKDKTSAGECLKDRIGARYVRALLNDLARSSA